MWENTIKLLAQKLPCISLLEDHIYFSSSLAGRSGPMFCRVEEFNLERRIAFIINGFGMEEAMAEVFIREEIAATALEEGEDKANIMYREVPSERRADEFALSILESVIL